MKRTLSTGIATTLIAQVGGGVGQMGMAAGHQVRLGNGLFSFLDYPSLGATPSDIPLGISVDIPVFNRRMINRRMMTGLLGLSNDRCSTRGLLSPVGAGLGKAFKQDFVKRDFVPLG